MINLPKLIFLIGYNYWVIGLLNIVNGGCRFALQARYKFIDQVRILARTRILWNHGRVLLSPGMNLVREMIEYKPGINNKKADKC